MLFRLGIIVFLTIYIQITLSLSNNSEEEIQYRLPNDTEPISYNIHITIEDIDSFSGIVTITLKVVHDTSKIVLHSSNLKITKISLMDQESNLEVEDVEYINNKKNQFLTINSNVLLKKGNIYVLTIAYTGKFNQRSRGFFTSFYYDRDIKTVITMFTSNFKPTNARKVFPCYDEPAFKAKFTIALTYPKFFTALSNMPKKGESIEQEGVMITTKFKESPLMSTYTVAFLFTTHRNISVEEGDITYRVFSPPSAKTNGENTVPVITKITNYFEEYFDIKYPLPKMDHINIPGMNEPGVGNWGLILYQFGFLLPTSKDSYLYNMTTNSVIAQKVAQQWIGNLVSPKWWSYNWLNEGLATFYAGKAMQFIYPQWDTAETELFMDGAEITEVGDRLALTRHVETRKEIHDIFNQYTKFKSAYLLRMFEHALTEDTFHKGIIQYLKDYQYSVVDEDDLFNSLQTAATKDKINFFEEPGQVAKVMRTWTNQKDFPIITVTRNYEKGTFKLTQNNRVKIPTTQEKHPLWWIPITYTTASSPNFEDTSTDFIFPEEEAIEIDPKESGNILNENDWLILNKKRIGHYSVNYDPKNWELIIETLKTDLKKIHVFNRAQLIRDAWKFVDADIIPKEILLNLLDYLKNEDEPLPWHEALTILRKMINGAVHIKTLSSKEEVKNLTRDIINNLYTIGFDHIPLEQPLWEQIRPNLLVLACESELVDCKSIMEAKFKEAVDGELEDTFMIKEIYCWYLQHATESEVEAFTNKWLEKNIFPFDKRQSGILDIISCHPSFTFGANLITYMSLNLQDILLAESDDQ